MKRTLSIILSLAMTLSIFLAYTAFAEEADATSAASEVYDETMEEATTTSVTTTSVPVPVIAEGAETYTVVPGDMLWKIARASSLTLDEIIALNPQIVNANLIYPGQVIIIKAATPAEEPAEEVVAPDTVSAPYYMGLGQVQNMRTRHFAFNIVTCAAVFDSAGKIISINWDILEVASDDPAEFPFPASTETFDAANATVQAWETKRELGDDYGMANSATTGNEWYIQAEYYADLFEGMTVDEVVAWTDKHLNATGDLIKPDTEDADEQAKLAAMTEEEKAELADVITSATMALRDDHGDFIGALVKAWENKTAL